MFIDAPALDSTPPAGENPSLTMTFYAGYNEERGKDRRQSELPALREMQM
jgi:hypothetical protein